MNTFTISQLAQFSGVKPHTIRMWEHRHNALQPSRSDGNTRYYDGQQLRRLLNIVSLLENKRKVSDLCSMKDEELYELLKEQHSGQFSEADQHSHNFFVSQLLAAGVGFDTLQFEKIMAHCLLRYGMKDTYRTVIYPLLQRIGVFWAANELPPAQEHFISNLLRQKLYTAIDSLTPAPSDAPAWLLFLPENEFHELGLLMTDFLLRSQGQRTLYLGSNVPLSSVIATTEAWPAENLLFFMVHRDAPQQIEDYLQNLEAGVSNSRLVLVSSPHLLREVHLPDGIKNLHSIPELDELLKDSLKTNN